ncbi:MAG: type I methionyl aminopeptidase [Candidatus Moranbacteria bacterium]|jgi:methionyl aminopeptidase|nr:type I methionyl aminopeptidase [Candidatus Moranbacteria bacterium]
MAHQWIKTEEEIHRLRESCQRLARVLDEVMKSVTVGMTTWDIDVLAERLIREAGGIPIFKGYNAGPGRPFPASLCVSLNNEVVHGIPLKERTLKDGDLLKLDIGMRFEGMVSDMARTMAVGTVSKEAQRLMDVTRESLKRGIATMRSGVPMSQYAHAVQKYVEAEGFSVVRDLVGHGVGHELHEDPQVPNYVSRHMRDFILETGMTLALEPMINAGTFQVDIAPDDWTFITADGKLSAHFEDTVVITENGAEILTRV